MYKKIFFLLSGNLGTSAILFARTILVARLISLEEFGIAATLLLSVSIITLMSDLGLNKMIVQSLDGEDQTLQHGLQGFQVLRGLATGVILFLIAHPMARFLGNEDVAWAYQLVALVPVLNSLVHYDMFRMQRQMNFGPTMVVQAGGPLISLLLVVPLHALFGDFRVMLYAVLAQFAFRALGSHLLAERPYRVSFNRTIMRQGFGFGWPMMVNGVLLAFVLQGEKLIVGREMGMAVLATFSMGTSLLQSPIGAVVRAVNQFMLPQLSALQGQDAAFRETARVSMQINLLVGVAAAITVAIFGAPLIDLALGPRYQPVIPLLIFFTTLEVLRAMRNSTALISLARAKTGNGLFGNIPRVVALPIFWSVLAAGYSLQAALLISIGAELCGFAFGLMMMRRRADIPLGPLLPSLFAALSFLAVLSLESQHLIPQLPEELVLALVGGVGVVLAITLRPLWRFARSRTVITHGSASE